MLDTIRLRRSTTSEVPDDLMSGEPFFSYQSNSLYIGNSDPNGEPIPLLTGLFAEKVFRDYSQSAVYYVSSDALNATDDPSNNGQSPSKPFFSIERAIIQGIREGRKSYSVMVSSGFYRVANNPGVDLSSLGSGIETNPMYLYNPSTGGVIVPSGCSIHSIAPGNTYVLPTYIPNACGLNQSEVFDPLNNQYVCTTDNGASVQSETAIFLINEDTKISGLSFRDKDFSLKAEEYSSRNHEKLFAIASSSLEMLQSLYDKVNKTFGGSYSPRIINKGEKTELIDLDLYSLYGLNGIKTENKNYNFEINNIELSTNGVGIFVSEEARLLYRNLTTIRNKVSVDVTSGGLVQGDTIASRETSITVFRATGGGQTDLTNLSNGLKIVSLIPPAELPESSPVRVSKLDAIANYDYYQGVATPAYDRLYISNPTSSDLSYLPGEVIRILRRDNFVVRAKLSSTNVLVQDGTKWYLSLDNSYSSSTKWTNSLQPATDFLNDDTGVLPANVRGKYNSRFAILLSGDIEVDRRIASRSDEDRVFKLRLEDTNGSSVPFEGAQLSFQSSTGVISPVYAAKVENNLDGSYIITPLLTNSGTTLPTITEIYHEKELVNDSYVGVDSGSYDAVMAIPGLTSAINSAVTSGTGIEIALPTQIGLTLRNSSTIKSNNNFYFKTNGVIRKVGGGLVSLSTGANIDRNRYLLGDATITVKQGNQTTIDEIKIEKLALSKELTIASGSKLYLEEGVEINPTIKGGQAGVNKWGFGQLAELGSTILSCHGSPNDPEVIANLTPKEDPNQLITKEILAQVIKSKTSNESDRLLPNGDVRKFVKTSDTSSTTLTGLSRVETVSNIVTELEGKQNQVTAFTAAQENKPKYVNAHNLNQGLLSIVANDSNRINYAAGLNLITSSHKMTRDKGGLGNLANLSETLTAVNGHSVSNNRPSTQTDDATKLINVYTLNDALEGRSANVTDLQAGTGEFFVQAKDITSISAYGISKLVSESRMVTITDSPNAGDFLSTSELNSSGTLVNAYMLDACLKGKKATTVQRSNTGNSNLLVNYSDVTSTNSFGIGKIAVLSNVISDIGGRESQTISNLNQQKPELINRHTLSSALRSLYASDDDLDFIDLTINNNRIIRAENRMKTNRLGVGGLADRESLLAEIGGSNTNLPAQTFEEINNEKKLVNIYSLNIALKRVRATSAELESGTNNNVFVTAADLSTTTQYGLTKKLHVGANLSYVSAVSEAVGGTYNQAIGNDPIGFQNYYNNIYESEYALHVPTLYSTKIAIDSRHCTPSERQTPTVTSYNWVAINDTSNYQSYGVTKIVQPLEAVAAVSAPRSPVNPTSNPTFLVGRDDKVLNLKAFKYGIDALKDNIIDETGVTPKGIVVSIYGRNPEGWLICNGGFISSNYYPELAIELAGYHGNPDPIPPGANFRVPNIPDPDNPHHNYKFIRR